MGFKVKELKWRTDIFSRAPNLNAERLWCNLQALQYSGQKASPVICQLKARWG